MKAVSFGGACESIKYGLTASADWSGMGPKFIRITDIVGGLYDLDLVPNVDYDSVPKYVVLNGDILVARTGASVGASYIHALGSDPVFASYLVRFRVRPEFDARYVYYVTKTQAWRDFISSNANAKSAQPNISASSMSEFEFHAPVLAQQRAVGEVLGALDDKIAANLRVQQSIDDLLAVTFRKASRSATESIELGKLIVLNYGKSLPASKRVEGPVAVVGSGGIVGYHDEPLVDGPAVVVGRKGSVGSTYWISEGCYPIDTTYWVTPREVSLGYAYRLLQSIDFLGMNTDSAVPGLNRERAYALQVPLPDEEQLEEFDQLSGALTLKHSALQKETAALARTRDELLPLLMDGRITVKDVDRAVGIVV